MSTHSPMNATTNGDDDDIIELDAAEADPLAGGDTTAGSRSTQSPVPIPIEDDEEEPMVINGTNSVGDSAEDSNSQDAVDNHKDAAPINLEVPKSQVVMNNNRGDPQQKERDSGLVIIDTNALLAGKGPIPLKSVSNSSPSTNVRSIQQGADSTSRGSSNITIPDDAFLIEAPSFIVPYVFEQLGQKNLRELVMSIRDELIKSRRAKIEAGEELTELDEIPEPRRPVSDDYFESPTGRLLMSVGTNLVQEYVQTDLLKIQKRQAEKERIKNFGNVISTKTTQSIVSLKKNLEESKENNEPFHFNIKKCELCNFKTESQLVLNSHLETPHMRNYSYRCNFCQYTTRVPQEILFHTEAEHNTKSRLER